MYKAVKAADQNGDRDLARQILHNLKDATPHDGRVYKRLARMEAEDGNVHSARTVFQEGLRMLPSNAQLWHGLAHLEMTAGDEQESRRCYMKAIQADPAFPNAYHALGTMEHSSGEIAKAMKILKTGLEYCPTNHRLHHALGDLYREAKMLDMAGRSFKRALEYCPEVGRCFSYTSLAHVAYELGDLDKSRSWLRKAVSVNDGRAAKSWLALARLEESENNIDAARSVCMTALNEYEKGLLCRAQKKLSGTSQSFVADTSKLESALQADPVRLKNELLQSVPRYRSGDHFLKIYRNWIRLEQNYGTIDAVDDVYKRASIAFPLDWSLSVDWANYHVKKGHFDRARLLFSQSCSKAGNRYEKNSCGWLLVAFGRVSSVLCVFILPRNALPYRYYAAFEMAQGKFSDAREILFLGARAISDSPDGGLGNQCDAAELYATWAICEWHLNNLSRAEVLFDHALRLVTAGERGATLRSYIFYTIALLEYQRGEHHLAQHFICLCLKENSMPDGNEKVWDFWSDLASEMGDSNLAEQCEEYSLASELKIDQAGNDVSATAMTKESMAKMMRKDPWHHKIFGMGAGELKGQPIWFINLPEP